MALSIIVLDQREKFLQHLDPSLCEISETYSLNGLRTLQLEYKFQDMQEDKELFKIGNKIWVQGDSNISDCLYLLNTKVEQDISENSFIIECEEVLVEMTYAPLHSHTDITTGNGFKLITENGKQMVKLDYNSLNFWFGEFFNIGVVQDCISDYAQYISVTGTMTPMALLRQIEDESGNVFITRYEKDVLNNTIHRYLDFLNPINVSKDWELNLEYKFVDNEDTVLIYDEDDELTEDGELWEDTPYSDEMPSESLDETVKTENADGEELYSYEETEYAETWDVEEQIANDEEMEKDYTPITNLNPSDISMRITKNNEVVTVEDTPLEWSSETLGFTDETQIAVISLVSRDNQIGIAVNEKSFALISDNTVDNEIDFVEAIQNETLSPVYLQDSDENPLQVLIPDDSYFEFYDSEAEKVLFRTCINREIGTVHEEVLDLGFNMGNIVHQIDESDTYTSVSPILELQDTAEENSTNLTRAELGNLIDRWKNLKLEKGQVIPMIVQKITVKASSLEAAKRSLGGYVDNSGANQSTSYANWWRRPYHPQDNIDTNTPANSTWEFLRGTAYWKAPYQKGKGELYVETDKEGLTQYTEILRRNDRRLDKGMIGSPKNGTTESSDEDLFQIYNQVALYLKDHEEPQINLEVEVANLKNNTYNRYEVGDKVYIKIPYTNELLTARVVQTTKEAHDVSKNKIQLSNYKTKTIKTITKNTVINANNLSYKYPASKNLTATLENTDYTTGDIQYPANKLINFTLYRIDQGSATFLRSYAKRTNSLGQATLVLRKFDPHDYKMEISFGGDEEFAESSTTVKINVSGTKTITKKATTTKKVTTTKKTTAKTKVKTTKKTSGKTKTVKTYWSKCGLAPDKVNKIIAIAQPSAGDGNYAYNQLWKTQFKNYCPSCKKSGHLRYDGRINKCITTINRKYKLGVPEHQITCLNCNSDYDGVTGLKKDTNHTARLTRLTNPVKSTKSEYAKLCKGQLQYGTKTIAIKEKKVKNKKNRKIVGKLSKTIKNKALEIVGEKTGKSAMMAIVEFMDKKIRYSGYYDFKRSPKTVLSKRSGNCCDQTRLFLQLCDGAGLTEYYKLYYCHVPGHVYAIVKSKKTGKRTYVDCASDYHTAWAYVCQGYSHGSPTSRYPTLPF